MEQLAGYARVLARAMADQNQQKPLLGKPYLKLGQCLFLGTHCFQLGGILAAKYSDKLDAFGPAFLGAQGEPGAVQRFFAEVARGIVDHYLSDSTTFLDYVVADLMRRLDYSGETVSFFQSFGMQEIKPATAVDFAWQCAESGAALGAIHPDEMRKMFDRSHSSIPKESWERARAAGLDIPPEQEILSYDDAEDDHDQLFMEYCGECCPDFRAILAA